MEQLGSNARSHGGSNFFMLDRSHYGRFMIGHITVGS